MLPGMDDKSLQNLFDNTTRIIAENKGKMLVQAAEVLPAVVAERARRKEANSTMLAERAKVRAAERAKAKPPAAPRKKPKAKIAVEQEAI
jgi:hypothetical protein